mmetsp:Transcript_61918/g.165673  ORF Transcript_61918/g.165673 Transcript_61918/m.165673 type:complete len:215 (+) Transcript_61918:95-739(+)
MGRHRRKACSSESSQGAREVTAFPLLKQCSPAGWRCICSARRLVWPCATACGLGGAAAASPAQGHAGRRAAPRATTRWGTGLRLGGLLFQASPATAPSAGSRGVARGYRSIAQERGHPSWFGPRAPQRHVHGACRQHRVRIAVVQGCVQQRELEEELGQDHHRRRALWPVRLRERQDECIKELQRRGGGDLKVQCLQDADLLSEDLLDRMLLLT